VVEIDFVASARFPFQELFLLFLGLQLLLPVLDEPKDLFLISQFIDPGPEHLGVELNLANVSGEFLADPVVVLSPVFFTARYKPHKVILGPSPEPGFQQLLLQFVLFRRKRLIIRTVDFLF
jgi:hypothetical protein